MVLYLGYQWIPDVSIFLLFFPSWWFIILTPNLGGRITSWQICCPKGLRSSSSIFSFSCVAWKKITSLPVRDCWNASKPRLYCNRPQVLLREKGFPPMGLWLDGVKTKRPEMWFKKNEWRHYLYTDIYLPKISFTAALNRHQCEAVRSWMIFYIQ